MQKESEQFEQWFKTTFLFSRQAVSPLLISENKTIKSRFLRICEVGKILIESPNKDIQEMRAEIAMNYFVSMRCALDYINYAKIVVAQFQNRKL